MNSLSIALIRDKDIFFFFEGVKLSPSLSINDLPGQFYVCLEEN